MSRLFPCIPCMYTAVFYTFYVGLLVLYWSMGLIPMDPTDRSSCFLSFSTALVEKDLVIHITAKLSGIRGEGDR